MRTNKKLTRLNLVERGAVEIAARGRWSVFVMPGDSGAGWKNYYLRNWTPGRVSSGRGIPTIEKRAFWLTHNGDRVARSADAGALNDRHPDVYAEVLAIMADHVRAGWLDDDAWRPPITTWSRPRK